MSDGNDTKTTEQLLAEIAALKEQLARRDAVADESAAAASPPVEAKAPEDKLAAPSAPVFAAPMTRRQSIVSWVAPVILSLPVVQAVGAVIKPGTAQAQVTTTPTAVPTTAPTTAKKPVPTAKPTATPTAAATVAPTAAATIVPTRAGRCIIAPTAAPPTTAPSAAPTIGMASTPDSRPISGGFVPLGGARALVGRELGQ